MFVQSAPTAHAPVHFAGLPEQLDVFSERDSTVKSQVAPSLQVTSQLAPVGHVNLQLLFSSHVSLHVRFAMQPKSQICPAAHLHSFPQLPFEGPGLPASGGVTVPDEEEDDEEDEDDVPPEELLPDAEVGTPPSPTSLPTFQSYEQPKASVIPRDTTSGMTRRTLTPP